MKRLAYILLILLCASFAGAETYWAAHNGTASWTSCRGASDPGVYCSIATANSNLQPGDTVYLRPGAYTTSIYPARSGTSAAARITYSRIAGQDRPTFNSLTTPINLDNRSYIKISGIEARTARGYTVSMQNYSSYNEVTDCYFRSGAIIMVRGMCGTSYTCSATHNWIHNNQIGRMAAGSTCTEGGDALRIGAPWTNDGTDDYNTIEDNTFESGGHGTIDMYGAHYTVIRNNTSRNEPWWTGPGVDVRCKTGADYWYPNHIDSGYDNLWGHRNFQIGFTYAGDDSFSLIEGNRLGYMSANPGNQGDANISIAGRGMLVRYNASFGSQRMGIYHKYVASVQNKLGGTNARVFNNTIYYTGWGFDGCGGGNDPCHRRNGVTWDGENSVFANYTNTDANGECGAGTCTGIVWKNNIIYSSRDGDFGACSGSPTLPFQGKNYVANNWCSSAATTGCTAGGNPLFVSAPTDLHLYSSYASSIATVPNLNLQAGSGAINGGTHLTVTTNSGSSSTSLTVADARYFQDGTWGSALAKASAGLGGDFQADQIAIGTVDNYVTISAINYTTKTITLATAKTWASGAPVWLYAKSDGTRVLYGTAPDYGAYEYDDGGGEPTPDTTPPTFTATGPSGTISCTTNPQSVNLTATTNENATVRRTAQGGSSATAYADMLTTFTTLDGFSHTDTVSLACGASYSYYLRAQDAAGNPQTSSTEVAFTIGAEDPDPVEFISGTKFCEQTMCDQQGVVNDTYLNLGNPTLVGATFGSLGVWTGASGAEQTILINVDLSTIPKGSTVNAAKLYLYGPFSQGGDASVDVGVYKVTELNNVAEASWTYRFGTTEWTTSGGGLSAIGETPEDTAAVSASEGWVAWTITDMVQDWVDDQFTNFGLLLVPDDGATSGTNRYFRSSNYTDEALRPIVIIDYTAPTLVTAPGRLMGVASGGGME